MKINSIVNRYIFAQMIPPFVINLLFFTFVFLLTRILNITKMIVNYKVGLMTVIRMIIYTIPYFLEFVIPISVMITVLLTFLRLSGDNEITALKSSGVSLYQILPPVFMFSVIGCLMTGIIAIYGIPWGKASLRNLIFEAAASHVEIGIKERTFNDHFKGVMLYVNKVDLKHRKLIDIFIEDRRHKQTVITIVAPEGRLYSDPEKAFHIKLFNGMINQVNIRDQAVNTIHFDVYDMKLDVQKVLGSRKPGVKDEDEMSLSELLDAIKSASEKDDRYYLMLMEFHQKFSIPLACLVLGLLAVPLGVESKNVHKSVGLSLGLIFFLMYYFLLATGRVFGESGIYPPMLGMWVPNIVLGIIAVFFLVRTANERYLMREYLPYIIGRLISRFNRSESRGG